uniref:BRD4 interacting chromatin remodeling complex associated protein n=1 Tax=Tetraodon nigroviridis TaxID=99883 RepID=H3BYJ9_TETNG
MDDEDGRCLLDVICDPEALNDFLHGSETHLDTDDLLDGSSDPSSSFFSTSGGHVPEVQPAVQLSANEPSGLPRVSVDLDFLEDEDILGGSPGGEGGSNGIGTNHEPCDILQQSLAEANITEQSLQEAEAELDLGSFGIPGLTQVVQTLPDASLSGAESTAVGSTPSATATPPNATADMLGSVLAQQGLQLQSQPFMQPVGLGNVTLQPISNLQALPNGSQSGHLGIGQIQVVGQPTVMTISQSGQPILAKAMGGYQLHQSGPEVSAAGAQPGLGSPGGGLLISSNSSSTMSAPTGIVGFGGTQLTSGIGPQTQTQGQIMQNVIIQRTPTPIQPKPPQGGAIQPKLFKPQQQQPQPASQPLQNDAHKALGLQQIPVSTAQNVAFLTGKPGSNVVLSTQATTQGPQFQQALFKQQAAQPSGKPLSVHLLNQTGSIVIPSQTVLQGQNHQFLLPQLQAGGQILTQHPGGHIITSQGPGGQLIANQILTANQNINSTGAVTMAQGQSGEGVTVLGSSTDQAAHPAPQHIPQSSILAMQPPSSASTATSVPSSSPSMSVSTSVTASGAGPPSGPAEPREVTLHQPGLQYDPEPGVSADVSAAVTLLKPSQSPVTLSQSIQSPHQQQQPLSSSHPQSQTPSRSVPQASRCTRCTAPIYASSCEHFHRRRQNPDSPPGLDDGAAAAPADSGCTNPNLVWHRSAFAPTETAAGKTAPGTSSPQIYSHTTIKMPFGAEPSKEARMLEQLRKQQGSVLHPNYSAPFYSFEDTLHRLLPYHLYQGTANSSQDYQRVDDEFERVSCQLLKRTQAMLDKYRYLLFAESKRLGPSAEMVMIDRMFIQEEKIALSQDKILAKERP